MFTLSDPILKKTLRKDKEFLENTDLPIITVSATYREDLKGLHGLEEIDTTTDIVFSRAHYSMALGIAIKAWGKKIDPKKAWIVDPTNYVGTKHWSTIVITELIGKILARFKVLKKAKDLVDKFGRQKLPILESITPPLIYLTKNIKKPILSFHIAAGNILAANGKEVIQVITDPHVREDYLANAHLPNIKFCVFDEKTRTEFFEKAAASGKKISDEKIIITGPPVDPRIIAAGRDKVPWRKNPLKLCITTGGLGTNKAEIKDLLDQLMPALRKKTVPYQVMLYAGTHRDIKDMAIELAKENRIKVWEPQLKDPAIFEIDANLNKVKTKAFVRQALPCRVDNQCPFTVLYHPQIVDANELLINFAFPWADGFITKPSGDMAYDAAAAGSFLLTLKEWGEWEHNIRNIFEQKNISREAKIDHIEEQLESLKIANSTHRSWVEKAMLNALQIDRLFLNGAKNIIKTTMAN